MTFRAGFLGGGLQGAEACCLARWAGWQTVLADARPLPPASGLADEFLHLEIKSFPDLDRAFAGCDLVVPTCEYWPALELLHNWGRATGTPVAFDPEAYLLSRDKARSKELFARAGAPAPRGWPEASYPLIAKPVSSSGSRGVTRLADEGEFRAKFPRGETRDESCAWVVEEYCPGPSYSLEITGRPGDHRAWLVTALEMDEIYDCRRVWAPADLSPAQTAEFKAFSLKIAEELKLTGLMDVEIIASPQGLRVLEIDARLPSQTPTVVWWGAGENLLYRLAENFISPPAPPARPGPAAVTYEHVKVLGSRVTFPGEHVMAEAGPLSLRRDFFGADWAVTDHRPGRADWAATLIVIDRDAAALDSRRAEILDRVKAAAR